MNGEVLAARHDDRLAGALAGARSGDLLLFSGRGFVSAGVRFFTGSYWSHVGLVLREGEELFVLEATATAESVDTLLGRPVRGVQVVSLVDKLQVYRGTIALRRLEMDERPLDLEDDIREIAELWRYRGYKDYAMNLLLDALSRRPRPQRVHRLFCSELVVEVYKRLGVMCRSARSSRFVPGDFGLEEPPLLLNARLSAPVFLKGGGESAGEEPAMSPRRARQRRVPWVVEGQPGPHALPQMDAQGGIVVAE